MRMRGREGNEEGGRRKMAEIQIRSDEKGGEKGQEKQERKERVEDKRGNG